MGSTVALLAVYWLIAIALVQLTGAEHVTRSRRVAIVAGFVAFGFSVAQAVDDARLTYPLLAWRMYSGSASAAAYREYIVTTDSGKRYRYPFRAVAFSEPRALAMRLDQLIRTCSCVEEDRLVDATIAALISIHHHDTGAQVTMFEVYEVPASTHERALRYRWSKRSVKSFSNAPE